MTTTTTFQADLVGTRYIQGPKGQHDLTVFGSSRTTPIWAAASGMWWQRANSLWRFSIISRRRCCSQASHRSVVMFERSAQHL